MVFCWSFQHVSERKVVFASNHCSKDLPERIKCISVDNGFEATEKNKKVCFSDIYDLGQFLGNYKVEIDRAY